MATWTKIEELQIPIPYGFIAAKGWGNANSEPVLALHGWQDNAGTFDQMIPLLSSDLYIVAVDSPGHGFSSHKPIGSFYYYMEMLVDVKRIIDYFQWKQFSIMGHSLGGTVAILFASVYPELVKNVVLLDIAKPASREPKHLPNFTRDGIDHIFEIEAKLSKSANVYTRDEALDRMIKSRFNEITNLAGEILLKRGCKPSECGKGVVFTRDIRLKFEDLQKFTHEVLKCYFQRLKCNLLIVKGTQPSFFKSATPEVLNDFLALYREKCKSFNIVKVDGNHFVHLNNPELVAPHVDSFFKLHCNFSSKI